MIMVMVAPPFNTSYGAKYSRMDQVKSVEDNSL